MKTLKKYWFVLLLLVLSVIRYLISYKLPSYMIFNLRYDDNLMIDQFNSLVMGKYLGVYSMTTLVKGSIFPLVLYYGNLLKLSFSSFLTILYILSCLYFINSLKGLIKCKWFLIVIYGLLLFNPVTYSAELLQRLYVNSISIIELLFFLGTLINIIVSKEINLIDYIILGTISALMILTRNDNIWIYIVIVLLAIIKLRDKYSPKRLFISFVPLMVILLGLNIVSFVNYKHYNIYTYNELENTYFKDAYSKLLQIKDEEKEDYVSVSRSTIYKLAKYSDVFEFSEEELDGFYKKTRYKNEIVDNGNIIWFFRGLIYGKYGFKDGKEANNYFYLLSKDIDRLFKEGVFEKEETLPNIYINMPSFSSIKRIPKTLFNAIWYTSSYKNVRTFSNKELASIRTSNHDKGYYKIIYDDYRYAENMIEKNPIGYEIIRVIYKYITIIFSVVGIVIYFKNIKKKDKLNIVINFIILIYIMIMSGVVYTDVTAFHAIRYRYLANIYILQSLFIIFNLYRMVGDGNDISSNTSL